MDDIIIYTFSIFGRFTFGFNYDFHSWVIYLDGRPIVVDKRFISNIDSYTYDEFIKKYPDKKAEINRVFARIVPIPSKLFYVPTNAIKELLETLSQGDFDDK